MYSVKGNFLKQITFKILGKHQIVYCEMQTITCVNY